MTKQMRSLGQFLLALIGVTANALGITYRFDFHLYLYSNPDAIQLIAVFALYYFYRKSTHISYKHKTMVWILASITSVLSLGYHIHNFLPLGYFEEITPLRIGILLLILICNAYLFRRVFHVFFYYVARFLKTEQGMHLHKFQLFGLFVLISLPSYIMQFPGSIQWDNGTMLQMAYGLQPLSNNNPLFHTGLMYLLRLLAQVSSATLAVALYTMLQTLLLCYLMTLVTLRLQSIHSKLVWLMLALYLLTPAFGNYASSLGKDLPFAMAMLYLCLLLYDLNADTEAFLKKKSNYVRFFFTGLLVALLRNIGVMMFVVSLTPLLLYLLFHFRKQSIVLIATCVLSVLVANASLHWVMHAMNIAPEKESANKSIQMQQVARVISLYGKESLSPEEMQGVQALITDVNSIARFYNAGISDRIKDLHKENATAEEIAAFGQAHQSLGKRYPLTYLNATYQNMFAYFIPGIHTELKPEYFYEYLFIEDIPEFSPKPHSSMMNYYRYAHQIYTSLPVINIFLTTGMIHFLHLIALCVILVKKQFRFLLVLLPGIVYALGLIASPVNGYYRYCLPTLLLLGISALCMLRSMQEKSELQMKKA